MIIENHKISDIYPQVPDHGAYITTYFMNRSNEINFGKRPAIVIFPGGAYWFTSDREADPVAMKYVSAGYQAVVVRYTCVNFGDGYAPYPQQLLEGAAAIHYVREHAEEWNIDPHKVAVIGFSAGGHLAGMMSTLYGEKVVCDTFGTAYEDIRPDATVLSYPVASGYDYGHRESIKNLLGETAVNDETMLKKVSIPDNVTPDTPPTFIWTTYDDHCVPAKSSMRIAEAMMNAGVECELHVFRHGDHGLSVADRTVANSPESVMRADNKHVAHWVKLSLEWLSQVLKD